MKNKYVIIRTRSAGVFAGVLKSYKAGEAILNNARRIWYWSGAASLSQLAVDGTSKPHECRFPAPRLRCHPWHCVHPTRGGDRLVTPLPPNLEDLAFRTVLKLPEKYRAEALRLLRMNFQAEQEVVLHLEEDIEMQARWTRRDDVQGWLCSVIVGHAARGAVVERPVR